VFTNVDKDSNCIRSDGMT